MSAPQQHSSTASTSSATLASHEPAPAHLVNASGRAPLVLACDHASNAVPTALRGLGLSRAARERHIAWDRGAAAVTRALAQRLDAKAVLANYSRLVIDLNRAPGTPESIVTESDGVRVPGNAGLRAEHVRARERVFFAPYHAVLGAALQKLDTREAPALFIAIHSFTPSLRAGGAQSEPRPWHYGVLWRDDPRVAAPLLRALRRQPGLCVGDNQPYSGHSAQNYSVDFHAHKNARAIRPSASIEIREDLIRDDEGQARASNILGEALEKILADPATRRALTAGANR